MKSLKKHQRRVLSAFCINSFAGSENEAVSKGILSSKNSSVTSCHLLYEQDFLDSPISIYCAKAIPNLTIKNYKS